MNVRRAWVPWLAAAVAFVATVRLGVWQLDRAAQKEAIHEARVRRAHEPALTSAALPATLAQAQAQEERRVVVAGRWLGEHTVFLDNRPMAGRIGFIVLTPLALADGRVLLVQRGWWPRDAADRTRVAAPQPPAGEVQLRGRVALTPPRLVELGPEAAGPIRQNLDLDAFARETALPLLPWLLVQLDEPRGMPAAADSLARQWPEPTADVEKNYGYAVQWFAMAAGVAALLLWFRVIRPRRRRPPAQDAMKDTTKDAT
ncbi:MAG: SURF1 family protein [Rubrivivax sp.]|nr:SURF1 family protein [Rubrivivax sp.]